MFKEYFKFEECWSYDQEGHTDHSFYCKTGIIKILPDICITIFKKWIIDYVLK